VARPRNGFQMTTAERHGIDEPSAKAAYDQMDEDEFDLYFVVPAAQFDQWTTPQPFAQLGKVIPSGELPDWTKHVRQWVLAIPLVSARCLATWLSC
jgi:hypothetical protein